MRRFPRKLTAEEKRHAAFIASINDMQLWRRRFDGVLVRTFNQYSAAIVWGRGGGYRWRLARAAKRGEESEAWTCEDKFPTEERAATDLMAAILRLRLSLP
jgi:hypothetical protein